MSDINEAHKQQLMTVALEVARLRVALRTIIESHDKFSDHMPECECEWCQEINEARQALQALPAGVLQA